MTSRTTILGNARACLGAEYAHRGRSAHACDCVGLIALASGQAKTSADRTDYRLDRVKAGDLRASLLAAGFSIIENDAAVPGDLVSISPLGHDIESHAGILSDRGWIHVTEDTGGVVETAFDERWRRLWHSSYQFPGVSDGN